MTSTEFLLPYPPLGAAEMTIVRWLKRPGDRVARGEPLLVAVNDRAEVAFPAAEDGILAEILVREGGVCVAGAALARLAPADQRGSSQPASVSPVPAAHPTLAVIAPPERVRASPVARRAAVALGFDITSVSGSGPAGRIMKADVLAAHARSSTPAARQLSDSVAVSHAGQPHSAFVLRHTAPAEPYALTVTDVDLSHALEACSRLQASFARRGIPLDTIALIAQAAVDALVYHPLLNGAWGDDGLILRRRIHLGLVGPNGQRAVARNAQDLNLRGLARALALTSDAEHDEPATFTLADGGEQAVWATPAPAHGQTAALAVGAIRMAAVALCAGGADRLVVRPIALLSLAYDARVLGQHHADAFLRDLKARLSGHSPC
jgi:pyruvate/2-oxoglutarate dehydrogenase complex dihydrolipoamide acyltransferase (E2) component